MEAPSKRKRRSQRSQIGRDKLRERLQKVRVRENQRFGWASSIETDGEEISSNEEDLEDVGRVQKRRLAQSASGAHYRLEAIRMVHTSRDTPHNESLYEKQVRTSQMRCVRLHACAFHPLDKTIVATAGGDSLCFTDCADGHVIMHLRFAKEVGVYDLAWSHWGEQVIVACAGDSSHVRLIDASALRSTTERPRVYHQFRSLAKDAVRTLSFSPAKRDWLLCGADDGTVGLWKVPFPNAPDTSAKLLAKFEHNALPVASVAFSPSGEFFAVAREDRIILWSTKAIKEDGSSRSMPFPEESAAASLMAPLGDVQDCVRWLSDSVIVGQAQWSEDSLYVWKLFRRSSGRWDKITLQVFDHYFHQYFINKLTGKEQKPARGAPRSDAPVQKYLSKFAVSQGSSPWIVAPTTRGDIEIHEVDSARLQWSERDASASVTDTTPPKFLLRDTFLRTFCRSATVNSDRSCVVSVNDRNCIAIWRRAPS